MTFGKVPYLQDKGLPVSQLHCACDETYRENPNGNLSRLLWLDEFALYRA